MSLNKLRSSSFIPGRSSSPLSLLQLINESHIALLWQSPERILPRCRRKSSVSGSWKLEPRSSSSCGQSEASIDKHWPMGGGSIAIRISRRGQARKCPPLLGWAEMTLWGHRMMSGVDQSDHDIRGDTDQSEAGSVWHVTRDTAIRYAYQELSSSIQIMSLAFYKGHVS